MLALPPPFSLSLSPYLFGPQHMNPTIYKITAMKFEDPKDGEAKLTPKYKELNGSRPRARSEDRVCAWCGSCLCVSVCVCAAA